MKNEAREIAARQILLIRHAEVASEWKGICYGALDVDLSPKGEIDSTQFADRIAATLRDEEKGVDSKTPILIFHSGLTRTSFLAHAIANKLIDRDVLEDKRLRERDYGLWQGKSWDFAYQSDPEHFHDLVHQPDTYRPPQGETTTEMQLRVVRWYEDVAARYPNHQIVAVSHSGPIAALAGYLLSLPATEWNPWIIGNLDSIVIDTEGVRRTSVDC